MNDVYIYDKKNKNFWRDFLDDLTNVSDEDFDNYSTETIKQKIFNSGVKSILSRLDKNN